MKPVPNQLPSRDPDPLRIALVAEAPGAEEVAMGYPFAGKSGWLLNQWLAQCGVSRSQCFVGNVCQCRPSPTSNDFNLLEWNGPEVQAGIAALRADLAAFKPNIVVALGNAALHLFRHGNVAPPKSAKLGLFQWPSRVGTWRGSLFRASRSFDPLEAAALREAGARGVVAPATILSGMDHDRTVESRSLAGAGQPLSVNFSSRFISASDGAVRTDDTPSAAETSQVGESVRPSLPFGSSGVESRHAGYSENEGQRTDLSELVVTERSIAPVAPSHAGKQCTCKSESSASPASTLSTNPPPALLPGASLTPTALLPLQPARTEQLEVGGPVALPPGAAAGGSLSSAGAGSLAFRSVEKAETAAAATLANGACAPSLAVGESTSSATGHAGGAAPTVLSAVDTHVGLTCETGMGPVLKVAEFHSLLPVDGSFSTFKVLSTYHPAATFRDPSFTYPLVNDLKRAVAEARSPLLTLPERNIRWDLSVEALESMCDEIREVKLPVGFDIEGGLGGLQCCSFATSPSFAYVIDLMERDFNYSRKMAAIASVLEDANVPKVLWNAAYERAILEAVASITLRNYEDGMLAWWERFSELPKGLDFVASILTREPYWAEGIGWDKKTGLPKVTGSRFWFYNGLDSCVSLEIWNHPLIRAVAESRTPVAFQ